MDREKVESSMIVSVAYDREAQVLFIEFKPKADQISGAVYSYKNFSPTDWQNFRNAESLGGHFSKFIKGKFPAERTEEPMPQPVVDNDE